jgi:2-iminobutanoate/2-iminopropanoate deaminase
MKNKTPKQQYISIMKKAIATTAAPGAIGPYSQAIDTGTFVYVSGQIPVNPATGEIPEGITAQTAQSIANFKAILAEAGLSIDNVVKTTVFLADMGDFAAMNAVYAENFTEPYPARSAVAVKELPKQVLVEIEVIALR